MRISRVHDCGVCVNLSRRECKPALVSRIILTNYLDTFTYEDMVAAVEHRIRVAGGTVTSSTMAP
jgi:hypothetical protein